MLQAPDPFLVELLNAVSTLEAEVKHLRRELDVLITKPEMQAVKDEIVIHRAVMAAFFSTLVVLCGWLISK